MLFLFRGFNRTLYADKSRDADCNPLPVRHRGLRDPHCDQRRESDDRRRSPYRGNNECGVRRRHIWCRTDQGGVGNFVAECRNVDDPVEDEQ